MYLAIDYGEKRIGLAIGMMIPKPFSVIENKGLDFVLENISSICIEEKITKIIIGIPEYDDGGESKLFNEIKSLGRSLAESCGAEIIYEPENFTSHEAERILKQKGTDFRLDKGKVDEMAATLLLEQYIERENNE
jgi:putative Holliday junction resolvase